MRWVTREMNGKTTILPEWLGQLPANGSESMSYKSEPVPIYLQLQPVLPVIIAAILVLVTLFSNVSVVTNMLLENLGFGYARSWLSGMLRLDVDDLDVPGENEEDMNEPSSRDSFRLVRRHSKNQSRGSVHVSNDKLTH